MTAPLPTARSPLPPWRDGDIWTNEVSGVTLQVECSAASSGGAHLTLLVTFPPGSPETPLHCHPQQTEQFTFLSGALRVTQRGQMVSRTAGEELVIPPGEPHAMWNPFDAPAVVRWQTLPALRTEAWLGQLLAFAAAGKTNHMGVPDFFRLARLLRTYQAELQLCQPPGWVQALLFTPAALLARVLRLR
jgi:quercetin dioxygenase-like cupin family protein